MDAKQGSEPQSKAEPGKAKQSKPGKANLVARRTSQQNKKKAKDENYRPSLKKPYLSKQASLVRRNTLKRTWPAVEKLCSEEVACC